MKYIEIFGVKIHNMTFQEALGEIKSYLREIV